MGYCDIVSKKKNLIKDRNKLEIQERNEQAVSAILIKSEGQALTETEKTVLQGLFGSKNGNGIYDAAIKVAEFSASFDINELGGDGGADAKEFKANLKIIQNHLANDPYLSARMQALTIKNPDPKFEALRLSAKAGESLPDMLTRFIVNLVETYKPARFEKRQARIRADLAELEAKKDSMSVFEYGREKKRLDSKLSLGDIQLSLASLGAKFFDGSDAMFNPIYAVHETYENKAGTGGKNDTARKRERSENGYFNSFIDGFDLINGTVMPYTYKRKESGEATDEKAYHEDFGDDVSPLAILFGLKKVNAGNDKFYDFVNIPEYLKDSIRLNAISAMGDIYKLLSYPMDSSEFNDIWGLDRSSPDYFDSVIKVGEKYMTGHIPQAVIAKSLGQAIYDSLPVQFQHDIDSDLKAKAIAELGLYALSFMNNANMIKQDDNVFTYGDKSQNLIQIAMHAAEEGEVNPLLAPKVLTDAISALEFIGAVEGREGFSVNPDHEKITKIRNSRIPVAKDVAERVKNMSDKPLSFTADAYVLRDLYRVSPELAYAFAGVHDVDTSKPVYDQIKEQSKVNYGRMQVDALVNKLEEVELGENFYLKYDFTVSERYMIDAIVNPQESKITRFLVTSDDLLSTLSYENGKINDVELAHYNLGLSQAFDLDPDKKMDTTAIRELGEKVVRITADGVVEFVKGTPFEAAYVALKELDNMSSDKLVDLSINKDAMKVYVDKLMKAQQKGGGFHTIQALRSIIAFENHFNEAKKDGTFSTSGGSGKFETTFTLESDAITSGMIITLVQMGTKSAIALAEKGGVYTKESVAKWKALHDKFNEFAKENGLEQFSSFNSGSAEFKLTHGWLKEFSKHVESQLSKNPDVAGLKELAESSAFADVYETVAVAAEKELELIKADLIAEIAKLELAIAKTKSDSAYDFLESKIRSKKLELAVANSIGKIKRSTAKPPTMVYIYGAMLSSIRQKLTASVVVPKIYELLNNPEFKDRTVTEFRTMMAAIQTGMYNKEGWYQDYLKSIGFPDNVDAASKKAEETLMIFDSMMGDGHEGLSFKQKSAHGFDFVEAKKPRADEADTRTVGQIVFTEKGISAISMASQNTVGAAFEKGFEEFQEIDKFRESIKFMEIVRFTIFKFKLNKAIKRAMEVYGTKVGKNKYKLSEADIDSFIAMIEKDGFGHSVNDINGGHQPLYAREKTVEQLRAILFSKPSNDDRFKNTSLETDGKSFKLNTGASGVIIIHSIDGFVDAVSSEMFNLIRIYDGSVSSINKLGEQAEQYNDVWAEANAKWNVLVQQMNQLAGELKSLEDDMQIGESIEGDFGISPKERQDIINAIAKLMDYKDIQNLSVKHDLPGIIQGIKDRYADSVEYADGGNTEIEVFHQYLSDSFSGSKKQLRTTDAVKMNEGAVDTVFGYLGKILSSIQAKDKKERFKHSGPYYRSTYYVPSTAPDGQKLSKDEKIEMLEDRIYNGLSEGNRTVLIFGSDMNGMTHFQDNLGLLKGGKLQRIDSKTETVFLKTPVAKKIEGRDSAFTSEDADFLKKEIDKLFDLIPEGYNVALMPTVKYNVAGVQSYFESKLDELGKSSRNQPNQEPVASSGSENTELTTEPQTAEVDYSSLSVSDFHAHSGGAYGADSMWGIIGNKFGIKSSHYKSNKDNRVSKPLMNDGQKATLLTDEQIAEGIPHAKEAAKALGKNWSSKPETQLLLARNWFQVKNADAIYAVAQIEGGYVSGGTGYAVAMAVNAGKPVFVFDPVKNAWFERGSKGWIKLSSAPKLTPNFAGIGSRRVSQYWGQKDGEYLGKEAEQNAITAIYDAYQATIDAMSDGDSSEELKEAIIAEAKGNEEVEKILQDAIDCIE